MLASIKKRVFTYPLIEKLLANLSKGRSPNHFFARLPPYCTFYVPNSIRKVVRSGIRYELDLSDYMEWAVFYGIVIEPRKKLYDLVKPGHTVFDIGANIGEVTLNLAKRVGVNGNVFSFEPDPLIFSKLKKNVSDNSFVNVVLNNLGLGEKEEEVWLAPEVSNNRSGTRVLRNDTSSGAKVRFISLDEYVNSTHISCINIIKIDVEGYELKVLKGAQQALGKFKPTLFIELDDKNLIQQKDSAKSLVNFIFSLGYEIIINAENGDPIYSSTDFTNCHFDIIAK